MTDPAAEGRVLRHVILFRLREGADADRGLALLRSFRPPGTLKWVIERSVDERKGVVIVEDATFVDQSALDAFRVSEEHAEAVAFFREHADWLVGDWWEASARS